jgi:hypothetical protein
MLTSTRDHKVGQQWALLRFEKPITCPPNSLLIGSRLDTDIRKIPHFSHQAALFFRRLSAHVVCVRVQTAVRAALRSTVACSAPPTVPTKASSSTSTSSEKGT